VNKRRSCFALISFCAVPALVVAMGSAILFTSAAVAFGVSDGEPTAEAATQEATNPRVFTGVITDDHCGARHQMGSDMTSAECTRMCVRNGSKYELVQGDRKYALAGSESELEGLAGQRANIAGTLMGSTIQVISINSGQ
jgi:hypothetical protein